MAHKFPYKWNLADGYPAKGIEYHGKKVFGTFVCGGGSTMGYKLAGYHHLGGVEIDPKIAAVYRANHKPEHFYLEDIRLFNQRKDLPACLYDLDLLDGSPPCSSFSMAGNREKDWGKKKQFAEGQAHQRLDDLVFEYVRTIEKLQPKTALLENVKGLITGNAKVYARRLKQAFEAAGYKVQVFLLNAASMGVPQKRERVFFIGQRKGLGLPELRLGFEEPAILFGEIYENIKSNDLTQNEMYLWEHKVNGDLDFGAINLRLGRKQNSFTTKLLYKHKVPNTITAGDNNVLFDTPRKMTIKEICKSGSYPLDYNFQSIEPKYLIGMSVPPVMTAQIAHQIYLQWLSKI